MLPLQLIEIKYVEVDKKNKTEIQINEKIEIFKQKMTWNEN